MDKLDQNIENAKQTHAPSPEFVPSTMNQVEAAGMPKKRRLGWKLWAPIGGIAVIALVATVLLLPHGTTPTTNNSSTAPTTNTTANTQSTGTPINPNDTTDAALTSDLNSINASMNQTSNDQSAADSSINDSQQQITVPTE